MSTVPIHYCCYLCLFDDTLSTYLRVENSFSFFLLTPNVKSLAWFARTLIYHHFIQSNSNYYHHTKMLSHRLENLYASSVLTSNVFYLVTLNIGSRACLGDLKKLGVSAQYLLLLLQLVKPVNHRFSYILLDYIIKYSSVSRRQKCIKTRNENKVNISIFHNR